MSSSRSILRRLTTVGMIIVGAAIAASALRSASTRWGTSPDERVAELPGDELVRGDHMSTRAITINAPASEVWKWLVQLGQGRGGFYSYDRLENLIGLEIHSASEIRPELQKLAVGDKIHLAEPMALDVVMLETGSHFVLHGAGDTSPASFGQFGFTWAFVIREISPSCARLIVRERYEYVAASAPLVVEPASLVSFLMSEKMLRGIKERAERSTTTEGV